jgi:hypothetical protein
MPIVQQASGSFTNATSATITPTLPGASSASNCVVVIIAANTVMTLPASWTSRTQQVNNMGHYMIDRAGVSLTSVAITMAAGQGTWWIGEIASGVFDIASGANDITVATSYTTPTLTPTAGTRIVLTSISSLTSSSLPRTVSGWTNSFVEQADVCQQSADYPMQGVAALDGITANGSTGYSTTTTYSGSSDSRSALIAAYATSAAGGAVVPNPRPRIVSQATHRSSNY